MDTNSYHEAARDHDHDEKAHPTVADYPDHTSDLATHYAAVKPRSQDVEFGSGWYHADALKSVEATNRHRA